MDVRDISSMALVLAIAGIIVSFSLLVMGNLQEEVCPDSASWVTSAVNSSVLPNSITGTNNGCCTTTQYFGTNNSCDLWLYSAAFNSTQDTIDGVGEFSSWFVIIALAIVFSIIVGIIVRYLGGAGRA